jgi:hypothetical protein
MQFQVIVLVPSASEDVVAAVEHSMEPFDARLKVPLHKEYVPQDEIDYAFEVFEPYGLKPGDMEGVLHALEEDSGCSGGIDEGGIYLITTDNPQRRWDSWRVPDVPADIQRMPDVRRDHVTAAILTPDGVWHAVNEDLPSTGDAQPVWCERAEPLLARYPDYLAVTVDCHL